MTIRERIEQQERESLSPYSALSCNTRGREREEQPCPVRTEFQRDRDRIIHRCKAFRRLSQKTQVFISPKLDHYHTRLQHSLEVAQIARTVAKALRLNEDLAEAIALAHDLGHPPFGHAGESALDTVYREYDPTAVFKHNQQGVRVVEVLEENGRGLNLTQEVREGILYHTKGRADIAEVAAGEPPTTMEGKLVKVADRIAYVNHDLEDAVRAGFITEEEIPSEVLTTLGATHSRRVGTMVTSIIENSANKPLISMDRKIAQVINTLKEFLFERVYLPVAVSADQVRKVAAVMRGLFQHYMEEWQAAQGKSAPREDGPVGRLEWRDVARRVCDHIAGMTDRYAMAAYVELFVPSEWGRVEVEPDFHIPAPSGVGS